MLSDAVEVAPTVSTVATPAPGLSGTDNRLPRVQDVVVGVPELPEFCNETRRLVMTLSTASAGRAATIVTCRSPRKTTTVLTVLLPDVTVAA